MRCRYKVFLVVVLSLILCDNCEKDAGQIIPNISFHCEINNFETDIRYNQNNPQFIKYDSYGKLIGTSGVVVYEVSPDIICVFDAMCPYERSQTYTVKIQDDGSCICPKCKSQFSVEIANGFLIKGPSKYALKAYRTELHGTTLIIAN